MKSRYAIDAPLARDFARAFASAPNWNPDRRKKEFTQQPKEVNREPNHLGRGCRRHHSVHPGIPGPALIHAAGASFLAAHERGGGIHAFLRQFTWNNSRINR
jgi:hypothetical protein